MENTKRLSQTQQHALNRILSSDVLLRDDGKGHDVKGNWLISAGVIRSLQELGLIGLADSGSMPRIIIGATEKKIPVAVKNTHTGGMVSQSGGNMENDLNNNLVSESHTKERRVYKRDGFVHMTFLGKYYAPVFNVTATKIGGRYHATLDGDTLIVKLQGGTEVWGLVTGLGKPARKA